MEFYIDGNHLDTLPRVDLKILFHSFFLFAVLIFSIRPEMGIFFKIALIKSYTAYSGSWRIAHAAVIGRIRKQTDAAAG